jgi:hypothetical protein
MSEQNGANASDAGALSVDELRALPCGGPGQLTCAENLEGK